MVGQLALFGGGGKDEGIPLAGEIQRRYAADWRQQFAPRLRLAAAFAQTAMHPPVSALLMAALRVWPGLLTQGARWGGKVRPSPALARIETPQRAPPAAHDTAWLQASEDDSAGLARRERWLG